MIGNARLHLLLFLAPLVIVWMMAEGMATTASLPSASAVVIAMPTPESWLVLPTLPPSASQADHGAEVYRLVCQACHGDRGQGLTDEWRASWAPADRNCWQSKCHAANHPPDGFDLPRAAPAIMGQGTLTKFPTAADLHAFIRTRMPWQQPGSLTDEEYWQLTAYLMRAHGLLPSDTPLTPANAASVRLAPTAPAAAAVPPTRKSNWQWWLLGGGLLLAAAGALTWRRLGNVRRGV